MKALEMNARQEGAWALGSVELRRSEKGVVRVVMRLVVKVVMRVVATDVATDVARGTLTALGLERAKDLEWGLE